MNIVKIIIVRRKNRQDVVTLETNIPEPSNTPGCAGFTTHVPYGQGCAFAIIHFEDIPYELIDVDKLREEGLNNETV